MGNSSQKNQRSKHPVLRFDDVVVSSNNTQSRKGGNNNSKTSLNPRSNGRRKSRMERTSKNGQSGGSLSSDNRWSQRNQSGTNLSASKLRERRFEQSDRKLEKSSKAKSSPKMKRIDTHYSENIDDDDDDDDDVLPPPPPLNPTQARMRTAFEPRRISLSSARSSKIVENFVPKKKEKTKLRPRGTSFESQVSNFREEESQSSMQRKRVGVTEEHHAIVPRTTKPRGQAGKAEVDESFVDYTVVPLLLRGNMDYKEANQFGEMLKKKYSGRDVETIMTNPYALFSALEAAGFVLEAEVKRNIIDDQYWGFASERRLNASEKRKSFVYYADREVKTKDRKGAPRRSQLQSSKRRESVRSEFLPTFAEDSDDEEEEYELSQQAIRQSIRFLEQLKQAESQNSKSRKKKPDL